MNVFVSRDGQTFGPYTVEQATEFLQVGQLLATDFALYEGESEWKTLGNLLGATEQQSIVSPVAQPHQPKKSAPLENSKTKSVSGKQRTKIKMNQGQSVVVAKQKGFVSRIISTLIVFSVTCIVVCGGVAGLYFAFPSKVSPIMKKFGFLSQEPVNEKNKEVSVAKEIPTNPLDITLNDEDRSEIVSVYPQFISEAEPVSIGK